MTWIREAANSAAESIDIAPPLRRGGVRHLSVEDQSAIRATGNVDALVSIRAGISGTALNSTATTSLAVIVLSILFAVAMGMFFATDSVWGIGVAVVLALAIVVVLIAAPIGTTDRALAWVYVLDRRIHLLDAGTVSTTTVNGGIFAPSLISIGRPEDLAHKRT